MNSIIGLIATIREKINNRRQDYVTITYTPPEDELYPMVLRRGHVEVDGEDTHTYDNATAIVNEDRSLTITSNAEIIGWHDSGTYWKVSSH